ncbi:uncharacterized protein LOC124356520 [Homalodisca vitripennis]|uniref:uncharacterized protein LOC124356520 n=1 Tax=Homalodisca vitripennis TaxID=197043 RepID=UPI001EEA5458|nr:uncharacterized protein LOC124356520 [Homalodisca vitripennis]
MTSCLLVSVIIVNVFFGQLFYLMKSKPRLTDIDSLQGLHDADVPIFTPFEHFLDVFDGLQNSSLSKLKDRIFYKDCGKLGWSSGLVDNVSDSYAVVLTASLVEFLMESSYADSDREIHVVKESVLQICVSQMMPTGSVFYDHFNHLIERLTQLGFFIKWRREYLSFVRELRDHDRSGYRRKKNEYDYLTTQDLRLAFWILLVGLLSSIFIFVGERCTNRIVLNESLSIMSIQY